MCTVSVTRLTGLDGLEAPAPVLRMACNRDELLARPAALAPRVMRFGDRRAILPIDTTAGGTWVAVNDAGVMFTLLNVNLPDRRPYLRDATSRGLVIPSILHCDRVASAQEALIANQHEPFRLVVVDEKAMLECAWDGACLRTILRGMNGRPLMFTSSGLGDHLVTEPRTKLFESLLQDGDLTATRQEQFHRHRWPDAPHLSVCMRRRDARTVSYTTVEVSPRHVSLSYLPGGPDADVGPSHWCLARA